MRRFLILVGGVILSAAAFSGPVAAAGTEETLYIALGDLLAWGDGASVPERNGYVPRLAGYFSGAKNGGADRLINLAVRGATDVRPARHPARGRCHADW